MLKPDRREPTDAALDERLTSLLAAAAAAPNEPGALPGEADALAAFRASRPTPRRLRMISSLTTAKGAAAAALSAGVLLTGGVGAAAAGSLPGAAQDTARELLSKVGVTVPGADDSSAGHADSSSADAKSPDAPAEGKGGAVSELAKDPDLAGVDHGAAVSDLASGGTSRAGDHGAAGSRAKGGQKGSDPAEAGKSADDHAPDTTDGDHATGGPAVRQPDGADPTETEKADVPVPESGDHAKRP